MECFVFLKRGGNRGIPEIPVLTENIYGTQTKPHPEVSAAW